MSDDFSKEENNNHLSKTIMYTMCWVVFILFIILIVAVLIYEYGNEPSIVNIDGKAYVEYLGHSSQLLDENGNEIAYTEELSSEHGLVTNSSSVGGINITVITDNMTGMNYILLRDGSFEDISGMVQILE